MKHSKEAEKLFASGCNCCQAVLAAYAEDLDRSHEDSVKLGMSFGHGMGNGTCGAVIGMLMVLGEKHGVENPDGMTKMRYNQMVKKSLEEFKNESSSLQCAELLKGMHNEQPKKNHKEYCSRYVRLAARIIEEADEEIE